MMVQSARVKRRGHTFQPSWELLAEFPDPIKGPLSSWDGFVPPAGEIAAAQVYLPADWTALWKELPHHYIRRTLRAACEPLLELDVDAVYWQCIEDPWSFLKTKSVVFNLAQAWVDCEREIGDTDVMPEPPRLPPVFRRAMADFSAYCHSPDYCTLADICLTSAELVNHEADLSRCHVDDFQLICPVNGGATAEEEAAGDFLSAETRRIVENRFHLIPTIMEYRTADLPRLAARAQQLVDLYQKRRASEAVACPHSDLVPELVGVLGAMGRSFERLKESLTFLVPSAVDPVVWHRDVVKFTAGYGGHKGSSGPQTPSIHLIDAFLGRESYGSALGEIMLDVRGQLQANHQRFIQSVADGPSLRRLAEELGVDHPVSVAFRKLVTEYVEGFLNVHRGKAIGYANAGFGKTDTPRIFTAGTSYDWPSTKTVTQTLRLLFDEATAERAEISATEPADPASSVAVDARLGCPMGARGRPVGDRPVGGGCPMGHR